MPSRQTRRLTISLRIPPPVAAGLVPGSVSDMKTRPAVQSNRGYGLLPGRSPGWLLPPAGALDPTWSGPAPPDHPGPGRRRHASDLDSGRVDAEQPERRVGQAL